MLKERVNWLSRYAVLWVRVMFDLPVVEKTDHRAAIKIRKILLDQGFAMTRFSVHFRMVSGEDKRRALENKIRKNPPEFGSVQILSIPYEQYENIKVFMKGNVRTLKKRTTSVVLTACSWERKTGKRQLIIVFNQLTLIQCRYLGIPVNPQHKPPCEQPNHCHSAFEHLAFPERPATWEILV